MSKIEQLQEILKNREEGYGGSYRTLSSIADLWTAYLLMKLNGASFGEEFALNAADAAEMMVLLKIARSSGRGSDGAADDRLDMAGYSLLAAEMAEF